MPNCCDHDECQYFMGYYCLHELFEYEEDDLEEDPEMDGGD